MTIFTGRLSCLYVGGVLINRYTQVLTEREEGGTPNIIGAIRLGLALHMHVCFSFTLSHSHSIHSFIHSLYLTLTLIHSLYLTLILHSLTLTYRMKLVGTGLDNVRE